jgi:hypothetical protein
MPVHLVVAKPTSALGVAQNTKVLLAASVFGSGITIDEIEGKQHRL